MSPHRSSVPARSRSSTTRSAVLDLDLDDDARAACDALVHPGNAVSDFYTTAFWMRAAVQ